MKVISLENVTNPLKKMRELTLDEARELSKAGKLNIPSQKGVFFDPVNDPHPEAEGNKSRNSFKWSCKYNTLGLFFQNEIKGSIFKAIDVIHEFLGSNTIDDDFKPLHEALIESIKTNVRIETGRLHPYLFKIADIIICFAQSPEKIKKIADNILFKGLIYSVHAGMKKYDSDAFVYEDERLIDISRLLKNEVFTFWNNNSNLLKCVDCFTFLMKEDIRWRRVFIQILKDIDQVVHITAQKNRSDFLIGLCRLCEVVRNFEFTEAEIKNTRCEDGLYSMRFFKDPRFV